MISTAISSPFSDPNSRFVSIHSGTRPRHLVPEVPVQVRARHLLERGVVRGVVGAHPPFGPDHLRYVGPGCALVGAQQPSRKTHSLVKTHLLFRVFVVFFLDHKSVGGRGCGQQSDSFFHGFVARTSAATWRILGWSPRSSLILVVSRHLLCFSQSLAFACVFLQSVAIACVFLLGFRRGSPLLVHFYFASGEARHCLCFSSCFPLSGDLF